MKKVSKIKRTAIPSSYDKLIQMHMIRPIHDEISYENALSAVYDLMAIDKLNQDQLDYLELLTDQIEKYEKKYYLIETGKNDPIENLKLLLKDHEMNSSDLGRLLGNRELGSRILNRKRNLTLNHISKLSKHFKVEPGLFLPSE